MNIKTLALLASGFLATSSVNAQDKLYKKNGDMLEVKVTEISTRTVSYKRVSNENGPTYTIAKGDVSRIVYDNGSEDYFGEQAKQSDKNKKAPKYGNNIISAIPMQVLTNNVGIGLSYERVLDKAGIVSFYLPVSIEFDGTANNINGTNINGKSYPFYYIMPGVKFYPTGSKGIIRYSVGPNIAFVSGKTYDFYWDQNNNIVGQGEQNVTQLGVMITNALNINPTAHLHMGIELGIGFTYMNKQRDIEQGTAPLAQFGFKIGYRF